MITSDKIDLISPALVKAQAALTSVSKDKVNPHFKSHYADLASVIEAVKGPLNEQGIAFLQPVSGNDLGVEVETVLLHVSGQWIRDGYFIPVAKKDPQSYCAAVTYARRYGLMSMVGLPAEDDDGEVASGRSAPKQITRAATEQAVAAMSISAKAKALGLDWNGLAGVILEATGISVSSPDDAMRKLSAESRGKVLAFLDKIEHQAAG